MQWEDPLTGSRAAAAGAELNNGFFFYWCPVLQVQWSSSSEAEVETEGGKIYFNSYSIYCPYFLLFPVRGWNVSVALACSGIWDRYPQAAAHSRASGFPAVASQADDRDARPRCPPPGIRQARSQRNPSSLPLLLPPLPSPVVTSARAVFQIQQVHKQRLFKIHFFHLFVTWATFPSLFGHQSIPRLLLQFDHLKFTICIFGLTAVFLETVKSQAILIH